MRYKTAAENAEKVEDELKAEKRKLQREVAVIFAPAYVIVPRGCFSDRVRRRNQLTVVAFKEKSAKEVVVLILHSAGFIEKEDPGTTGAHLQHL